MNNNNNTTTKTTEHNELIATRIPPGDRWMLKNDVKKIIAGLSEGVRQGFETRIIAANTLVEVEKIKAEANAAKYLAADAGFQACDAALQTHGGFGYAREYHIERLWREARLFRLAPVSQEMVLNYLSERVLGLPKSY